jgi:hypothetical protein
MTDYADAPLAPPIEIGRVYADSQLERVHYAFAQPLSRKVFIDA